MSYAAMNRRSFLAGVCGSSFLGLPTFEGRQTRHLIFINNGGGARKRDYYEDVRLAPNIHRLVREGFVFEEDHCERVASHDAAFEELLRGRPLGLGDESTPTILDYIGDGFRCDSILGIPQILEKQRPRLIVCRNFSHDVGHEDCEQYRQSVAVADRSIGKVFDWVKNHPDFSRNTAIVIRPEFGRDDVVNDDGQLHHSYGFYETHRVATIFWGPDFNRGVDRKTVISSLDLAPTLTKLFGVDAIHAQGRVVPGLFR
jgi:hypothetical protein